MSSEEFDDILDRCLSTMQAGTSIDDCVAPYPEHAEALRAQLRVVQTLVGARPRGRPQPAAQARGRARLLSAVADERQASSATPLLGLPIPLPALFGRARRLALLPQALPVALVLLVLSLGSLTAAAAVLQPNVPVLRDVPILQELFGDGSSSSQEAITSSQDSGSSSDPLDDDPNACDGPIPEAFEGACGSAQTALANAETVCGAVATDGALDDCADAVDAAERACEALPDAAADACDDATDAIEDAADDALDDLDDDLNACDGPIPEAFEGACDSAQTALDNTETVCGAVATDEALDDCENAVDAAEDACDALPDAAADACDDEADGIEDTADDALDDLEDDPEICNETDLPDPLVAACAAAQAALDNAETVCDMVVDEATLDLCEDAVDAAEDACDDQADAAADACDDQADALEDAADDALDALEEGLNICDAPPAALVAACAAAQAALDNAAAVCGAVVTEGDLDDCEDAVDAAETACEALPDAAADACDDEAAGIEDAADNALDAGHDGGGEDNDDEES